MIMERFNKDSFKPFDKVLVREGDEDQWIPQFFARWQYTERYLEYAVCIGDYYRPPHYTQVIPYNDETEYLAFEYDKAPVRYNYWDDEWNLED